MRGLHGKARSVNEKMSSQCNSSQFTRVRRVTGAGCEVAACADNKDTDDTAAATHSAPSLHTVSDNHCSHIHYHNITIRKLPPLHNVIKGLLEKMIKVKN